MIKIIIAGFAGKMGRMIHELVLQDKNISVVAGLESPDHPLCADKKSGGVMVTSDPAILEKADVIVDFTHAEGAVDNIRAAASYARPIVVGTTGFNDEQMKQIRSSAGKIPVLLSPNMSAGVHLLFKLARITAGALKDFEIEIIEAHHNKKKDAPSGTAVKLAEIVAKELNIHDMCYGRKGSVGARPAKQIGIHAVRAGDIVGDHTVIFAGRGERIELVHRAHSRETFAAGALRAVRWIHHKKPGLYGMEDVLDGN